MLLRPGRPWRCREVQRDGPQSTEQGGSPQWPTHQPQPWAGVLLSGAEAQRGEAVPQTPISCPGLLGLKYLGQGEGRGQEDPVMWRA